jgi:hypothetical protein
MGVAGLIPGDFEPGWVGVRVSKDRLRAFDVWFASQCWAGPPKDPDKEPPDPGQSPGLDPDFVPLPTQPEDFPNWEDKPEEEEGE